MKELLVMRHAKSSWDTLYSTDFERPLNKRGQVAAPRMGDYLVAQDLLPDLIVSSPAERAKQTAKLFMEAADYATKFEQMKHPYYQGHLARKGIEY